MALQRGDSVCHSGCFRGRRIREEQGGVRQGCRTVRLRISLSACQPAMMPTPLNSPLAMRWDHSAGPVL